MGFWKKRQTWVPAAYLHFPFFGEIRAWIAGSPSPACLRSTLSIGTDPETWTLSTQAAKSSSSQCLWHVTSPNYGSFHMTSVCNGGSHFFFARGKWIHYPAARRGAGGCVTLGWFGFHACVGVWANLRSHFHWCWHIRLPSETCLSNCNMLCRKIRLLMLQ